MKKIVALVLVAAFVCGTVVGCGGTTTGAPKSTVPAPAPTTK